jgi:hypothetical protein
MPSTADITGLLAAARHGDTGAEAAGLRADSTA